MDEMESKQANVAIRLMIVVGLLAVIIFGIVAHLACNNHKEVKRLEANLLYT